jgi:hypothetical protein
LTTGFNAEMPRIEASWNKLAALVDQVQAAGGVTRVRTDRWSVKDNLVQSRGLGAFARGAD